MICRPELHLRWIAAVALMLGATAAAAPAADLTSKALNALARGDGIAAEVAAKQAFDAGAPRAEVAALIGEAELLQGDYDEARDWLADGDFTAATRQQGFHALGRLEIEAGDFAAAARAFDQALASGPDNARLWVDIGRLRYLSGQHFLAVDAARRAVAINPDEPRALLFQAQLARDAQGALAALPMLAEALGKAPDDITLLGEYAATLGEAGRHKDMLEVARRMVQLDPGHPRAYFLQATLAARAGLDDLARRLLARTNGAYDETPAGMLLAGIVELRTGNPALAVERFDDLAGNQPDNLTAHLLAGRALLTDREASEVVARYGPVAARAEASPYLLMLVGRAYELLGQRAEAASFLDRAAGPRAGAIGVILSASGDGPAGAEIDVPRIRQELAQGRIVEARADVGELAAAYPDSIDVSVLKGDVALIAGDPAGALAAYSRAAAVRRDFSLVERIAIARRQLGQVGAADTAVADYLRQNPRCAHASALLGRMRAAAGDWRRARLLLAHADALGGGDAQLLSDLALASLELGDLPAASEAASRAHQLQRSNGKVAATLARVMRAGEGGDQAADALLAKSQWQDSAAPARE